MKHLNEWHCNPPSSTHTLSSLCLTVILRTTSVLHKAFFYYYYFYTIVKLLILSFYCFTVYFYSLHFWHDIKFKFFYIQYSIFTETCKEN